MNVKLIRMQSGEDVIADLIREDETSFTVMNPIVAIPTQNNQMGFAPWSPLLKDKDTELTITKSYLVYIAEPQEQIVDSYTEMFSIIETPPKKKLIVCTKLFFELDLKRYPPSSPIISEGPLGQSLDITVQLLYPASTNTNPGSSHKEGKTKASAFFIK